MHAEEEQRFFWEAQANESTSYSALGKNILEKFSIMHHSAQAVTTCVLGKRHTTHPDRLSNHKRARAAPPAHCDTQKPRTRTRASNSDKEGAQGPALLEVPFAVHQ